MKLYKVNIQTYLDGFLVGTGTYDADRIGKSASFIEQYCNEQKALPIDKRHLPPYFEIIDTDVKVSPELKAEQKFESYIGMNKKELLDMCKQRGIEATKRLSEQELVVLLSDDDKKELAYANPYDFHDTDTFLSLSTKDQCEYLDEIFTVPDGVEDDSEEEVAYFKSLKDTVTLYSGLSIESETVDKIKEILEYTESEEG